MGSHLTLSYFFLYDLYTGKKVKNEKYVFKIRHIKHIHILYI